MRIPLRMVRAPRRSVAPTNSGRAGHARQGGTRPQQIVFFFLFRRFSSRLVPEVMLQRCITAHSLTSEHLLSVLWTCFPSLLLLFSRRRHGGAGRLGAAALERKARQNPCLAAAPRAPGLPSTVVPAAPSWGPLRARVEATCTGDRRGPSKHCPDGHEGARLHL